MKSERNLIMKDLKHRGVKPESFWKTDNGALVIGAILGMVGGVFGIYF